MNFKKSTIAFIALAVTTVGITSASACTALHLEAKDGGIVVGRTMEFGLDVKPDAVIVPVGFDWWDSPTLLSDESIITFL
jgi:choloylglycine hydrolase